MAPPRLQAFVLKAFLIYNVRYIYQKLRIILNNLLRKVHSIGVRKLNKVYRPLKLERIISCLGRNGDDNTVTMSSPKSLILTFLDLLGMLVNYLAFIMEQSDNNFLN